MRLRDKLRASISAKNEILTKVFGQEPLEAGPIIDAYIDYGEQLAPYVADTSLLLNQALDQGKTVLCEGAQGTLLDIDHGTYPYVTSSSTPPRVEPAPVLVSVPRGSPRSSA